MVRLGGKRELTAWPAQAKAQRPAEMKESSAGLAREALRNDSRAAGGPHGSTTLRDGPRAVKAAERRPADAEVVHWVKAGGRRPAAGGSAGRPAEAAAEDTERAARVLAVVALAAEVSEQVLVVRDLVKDPSCIPLESGRQTTADHDVVEAREAIAQAALRPHCAFRISAPW